MQRANGLAHEAQRNGMMSADVTELGGWAFVRGDRRGWLFGGLAAAASAAMATGDGSADSPVSVAFRRVTDTDGEPLRMDSRHPGGRPAVITALASDRQGRLLAVACDDRVIRLFELETLAPVTSLVGHHDLIRGLDFDTDGERLASAGNDGQILIWSCQDWGDEPQRHGVGPAITGVRFSPSSDRLAAVGFDDRLRMIRLGGGATSGDTTVWGCGCHDLRSVAYRPDGRLVAVAGRSGEIELFELPGEQPIAVGRLVPEASSAGRYPLHRRRIRAIGFQPDGQTLVTAGEDGVVCRFDTETRQEISRLRVTRGRLFALAIIDESYIAVAGSDNAVRIFDTDVDRVIHEFSGHTGSVAALAAGQGWLFSGGYDATLRRWPVEPLRSLQRRIAEGESRLER